MSRLLIVDDNPALREQYAYDLRRLGGHEVLQAADGDEALATLAAEPVDCMVLDLEMPRVDGFAVLRRLQGRNDAPPVIVYTGTGDYDRCVQAVKLGAYGFVDKDEPVERVAREIENALAQARLRREVADLRRRLGDDTPLVGDSPAMDELRAAVARLAPVPSPALVLGESGTGKELVARELHRLGAKPREPFVAVNCAALPESLVESELFGHERGAFTGAARLHRGAFERAGAGTLFLDEIGDLPAPVQAKLLRVLEQRTLTRVGGDRELPVACRIVAATNRDLDREAAAGRFREDLFFRLNVHMLRVPPLRERRDDVPVLAEHFLREVCIRLGRPPRSLAPAAAAALRARDWRRNNVRELRNAVERMVIACDALVLDVDCVPPDMGAPAPAVVDDAAGPPAEGSLQELREEAERRIVRAALARHDGHLTNTARALGLADHASLYKVMKRLGLER